jgi:hypothetical protein
MPANRNGRRGHGLAPWMVAFAAKERRREIFLKATGLPRGWLRSLLPAPRERIFFFALLQGHRLVPGMVTLAATESSKEGSFLSAFVAANVSHHGASPWHRQGQARRPKKHLLSSFANQTHLCHRQQGRRRGLSCTSARSRKYLRKRSRSQPLSGSATSLRPPI